MLISAWEGHVCLYVLDISLGGSKEKGFGDGVNIKVGMAHRKATTTTKTTAAVYKMCQQLC